MKKMTSLINPENGKHAILFCPIVSDEEKKVYNIEV